MTELVDDLATLARAHGVSTARVLDVSDADYHADPCHVPSLSSSIAHTLLERSPLHAWHEHPKLGGGKRAATRTLDRGSLIHKLVLGEGADVRVIEADSFRSKLARETRDEARSLGEIPVLEREYEAASTAATEIIKRIVDAGVELVGETEIAIQWLEPVGSEHVVCRGRIDNFDRTCGHIRDLKTTASAHPRACVKSVIAYGYDTQQAAYTRAAEALVPELAGRIRYTLIFAEPEPPYAVTIASLDAVLRERGQRRWRSAVGLWAQCMRDGVWPAYDAGPVVLEAPAWALAEEWG